MKGNLSSEAVQRHHRLIDGLLEAALPRSASFADLLPRMAGAGPLDVVNGLRRIRADAGIQARADALICDASAHYERRPCLGQPASLPLPHPLDSEWRFCPKDVDHMVAWLLDSTTAGEELLLVGTPSVAVALREINADRRIRFVGPNDLISDRIAFLFDGDTRYVRGGGNQAAAAIVDPPWYNSSFTQMLAVCARECRPGASVLTVMPRPATRPDMAKDTAGMLTSASVLGLESAAAPAFEVCYRTPLFEACALERGGLGSGLGDWRRGDGLIFFRTHATPLSQLRQPAVASHAELMLDGCRVRLILGMGPGPLTPVPIEDAEVSESVSARSMTRRQANLWTTTNRAFRVDEDLALSAFALIAESEGIELPPGLTGCQMELGSRNSIEAQANLIQHLYDLFARETADANRLAGEGSWLREAKGMRYLNACSGMSLTSPSGGIASARSSRAMPTVPAFISQCL